VVIATDGAIKGKGAYRSHNELEKKSTLHVVSRAAQDYFCHGAPVAETVARCDDILDFVNYSKMEKGWRIVNDAGLDHGGIARWHLTNDGSGVHLDKVNAATGKKIQLVDKGARVIEDLPKKMPDDVDRARYTAMAEKLVAAITHPEITEASTIPLTDLSSSQRAILSLAQAAVTPDLVRCATIDLETLQRAYEANDRGNRHDTLRAVLIRAWLTGDGGLTVADLRWLAEQLDPAEQRRKEADDLCAWIVRKVSPFPLPRTGAEQIARAMDWCLNTVTP